MKLHKCHEYIMYVDIMVFCTDMWHHDIALVKLKEEVPHGSDDLPHIQSVRLPSAHDMNFPPDGTRCVMKGWGCSHNGMFIL